MADDTTEEEVPELPEGWVPAHEAMSFLSNVYRDPASSDAAKRHSAEAICTYWLGQQLNSLVHLLLANLGDMDPG